MIVGLLLAGGAGRRFGAQKLVAPLAGSSVVRLAATQLLAAPLDEVVVVTGHDAPAVRAALDGLAVTVVHNAEHAEGMASAIRAGVHAVADRADAVAIALGDQPGIAPAVVARLVAARSEGATVVVPVYRGARGHPVLFGRERFDELLALAGDRGARAVVERDPALVRLVAVDAPLPIDVDTPAALEALQAAAITKS